MKKILSVSILAMLTVAPLAANADAITFPVSHATEVTGDTTKVVTATYVKGAYDAAVDAINAENVRATGVENGINAKIGTADTDSEHSTLYKTPQGGGAADVTVYGNLEALEAKIDQVSSDAGTAYVTKTSASAADSKGADQTLHYATGNGTAVGSNLAALDAQVYTNKTGIDTLTTNTTVTNAGNYLTANGNVAANLGALDAAVGQKSTLTTTEKGTIVAAINEVDSHADDNAAAIGTMANLGTATGTNLASDNGNLVVAVNKLDADMGSLASLNTTEKDSLVGAINEVASTASTNYQTKANSEVTAAMITANGEGSHLTAGQGVGANLQALDSAILANETDISTNATNIGTLSGLTTTAKDDLVAAVNEVNSKQLTVYSGWNGGAAPTAASSTVALTPAQ